MFYMFQVDVASSPAPARPSEVARASAGPINLLVQPTRTCEPSAGEEVVVCGTRDAEQHRLRPLPLPSTDGSASRPLRVQIAPGVSIGFQDGGGLGLRVEFGAGKKDGSKDIK